METTPRARAVPIIVYRGREAVKASPKIGISAKVDCPGLDL